MRNAMGRKNWDEALDDVAAAEKLLPEGQRVQYGTFFAMNRFTILLARKDYPAAYKLAGQLSDDNKSNAALQNALAWQIVTDKSIEKPDLELAERLADRANQAANGTSSEILDTQARVLFMKGQKEEAVKAQSKAVALAEPDHKPALQSRLDSYKKGELPAPN
jgi:tetratricopeptide (TPR) repeat protein